MSLSPLKMYIGHVSSGTTSYGRFVIDMRDYQTGSQVYEDLKEITAEMGSRDLTLIWTECMALDDSPRSEHPNWDEYRRDHLPPGQPATEREWTAEEQWAKINLMVDALTDDLRESLNQFGPFEVWCASVTGLCENIDKLPVDKQTTWAAQLAVATTIRLAQERPQAHQEPT